VCLQPLGHFSDRANSTIHGKAIAVSAEYYRKVRMIAKTPLQKSASNIRSCLRPTKIRSTNFVRAK
jgi:hypothetical protein